MVHKLGRVSPLGTSRLGALRRLCLTAFGWSNSPRATLCDTTTETLKQQERNDAQGHQMKLKL